MTETVTETSADHGGIKLVKIGTRRSQLAIAQVDMVIAHLKTAVPDVDYEMKVVSTMADRNQIKSFQEFNATSIWTEELEKMLLERELDVIVHCVKDMPTQQPESLAIGAICEREDPLDVVVLKTGSSYSKIQDLPAGAVVGTSSVRRKAQILHFFPHLKVMEVRGNVNTRLAKLDAEDGPYECLILAAAGLKRIDLGHRISQYLTVDDGFLYAPGQGALALQIRDEDAAMVQLLSSLANRDSTLSCQAEKNLLRVLEGGCSAPIGTRTVWKGDLMELRAHVISPDGKTKVESSKTAKVTTPEEADELGRELAEEMLGQGADKILKDIRGIAPEPTK